MARRNSNGYIVTVDHPKHGQYILGDAQKEFPEVDTDKGFHVHFLRNGRIIATNLTEPYEQTGENDGE